MIGALVITHGRVAMELVSAARRIVKGLEQVEALSLGWSDEVEGARERVQAAMKHVESEHGVLILTDMFGGTPTNIALTFLEESQVEVVTGVNLPMLLRLAGLLESKDLAEAARELRSQGQTSISIASELLAQMEG